MHLLERHITLTLPSLYLAMGTALSDEFNRIEPQYRVDSLIGLVKQCSYQQQLEFVEKLQRYLHKDFLAELPSNLSQNIIYYLTIEEACNCMLVSKKWNQVVGECTNYWEASIKKIGVSEGFVRENISKYKTLKDLSIAARNHQQYVRSLVVRSITVARTQVDARYSYHYAGRGISLRYEELEVNSHAHIVIEKMGLSNSLVQIGSFTTTAYRSRIKWSGASETNVIWRQVDGKWNSYNLQSSSSMVSQWEDEPVSQAFHSITFCKTCHLVAIISEAEDDCEVWDLKVVKLVQGKSAARTMVYPIPVQHMQKTGTRIRHYLGGEITLIPERRSKSGKGFCETHRVLLQVDNCVAVHRLESVPRSPLASFTHLLFPDVKLSRPLHVFEPLNTADPIKFTVDFGASRGPSKFILSSDHNRIGVLHENYLLVWNLTEYTEESCVDLIDLNLPDDTRCIALGSMYAVLASNSWGTSSVVATSSGEILTNGSLADITFNPMSRHSSQSPKRFIFYSPLVETWLSSLQYFDFWPLAIVFDTPSPLESYSELQAVVGVQSRQRSRRPDLLSCF